MAPYTTAASATSSPAPIEKRVVALTIECALTSRSATFCASTMSSWLPRGRW